MNTNTFKKPKKRIAKPITIGLFTIIGYLLLRMLPTFGFTAPETIIAPSGSIESTIGAKGVIIREESVVYSSMNGYIKHIKEEGERVPVNSKVLEIYQDLDGDKINAQIEVIQSKLQESMDEQEGKDSIFKNDIESINKSIDGILLEIEKYSLQGNSDKVSELRGKLNKEIEKKYIIIENIGVGKKDDKWLRDEKNKLEKKLEENSEVFYAKVPGVISYSIDNYESILVPSKIHSYTAKDIQSIRQDVKNVKSEKTSIGEPVFKIIDNYRWYIAFDVDKKTLQQIPRNRLLNVRINGEGEEIPFRIYNITEEDNGNSLVTLTTSYHYSKLDQNRVVDIEIIITKFSGIKLPITVLSEKEGQVGVFAVDINGIAIFKPVEIIGQNKEYVIIKEGSIYKKDSITLYDQIILKASKVKENQLVDKLRIQ